MRLSKRAAAAVAVVVTAGTASTMSVASAATPTPIAINAGGSAFSSSTGFQYASDRFFQGGSASTAAPVSGTLDAELYRTLRYGMTRYSLPVVNGTYDITLKMIESYFNAPGRRVFNVAAEGVPVLSRFDIYASAAGRNKAVDRTFTATVTDGRLDVTFSRVKNFPAVAALAATPRGVTAPQLPAPNMPCTVSGATGASSTTTTTVPGATPNDGLDDFPAIQSAINNAGAAGGGVVTLPAGTFLINKHLMLKSGVRLQGVGPQTVIKAGPSFLATRGARGGYPVISTNGAVNVSIANLTADQSGDTLNGNVPGRLHEYLVDIRDSRNALVDGVHTRNPFTYSLAAVGSSKFCIRNSSTRSETRGKYNQLDGIHVLNSAFGDVIGNDVDQRLGTDGDDGLVAHTMGGSVHDVRYAANKVRGGNHGAAMQLAYTNSTDRIYNISIQGNEFWGSPLGIHTGTYGTPGSADRVTVGGSPDQGNYFHDNDGNAINFYGSLSNITVTHNRACRSGTYNLGAGVGNLLASNTTTC